MFCPTLYLLVYLFRPTIYPVEVPNVKMPIAEMLQQALYSPILIRYEEICEQLMQLLKHKYHLSETFDNIKVNLEIRCR